MDSINPGSESKEELGLVLMVTDFQLCPTLLLSDNYLHSTYTGLGGTTKLEMIYSTQDAQVICKHCHFIGRDFSLTVGSVHRSRWGGVGVGCDPISHGQQEVTGLCFKYSPRRHRGTIMKLKTRDSCIHSINIFQAFTVPRTSI